MVCISLRKMGIGVAQCLLVLALVIDATSGQQTLADYMADNLKIEWDVVDNYPADNKGTLIQLRITNDGNRDVVEPNWVIYMPCVRTLATQNGTEFGDGQGLFVRHVNGDIYTLEPTSGFQGFHIAETMEINFRAGYYMVAVTDILPNWYVISDATTPKTIQSTVGESLDYVGPFDTARKWKRRSYDKYDPFTPEVRLDLSGAADLGDSALPVIPQPVELPTQGGSLHIDTQWKVYRSESSLQFEADYLAERLNLPVVTTTPTAEYIELNIGTVTDSQGSTIAHDEAYNVLAEESAPNRVVVTGKDAAGVFYGVQTVLSLAAADGNVPIGKLTDYPRFSYRGMHMDVSRNFHPVADVKRHMDVLATYKMNQFHFHITDDEGWRLEIPGLPELTEVGAKRCHDLTGDQCIMPQLGAGPTIPNHGTGFFSTTEYKDILNYANDRHITVVPEFDMPGHCHAVVNAMEARYRKYKDVNVTQAEEYLLSDLEDTSDYLSVQDYNDNVINPCINSSYRFVDHLLTEVVNMHKDIQPLPYFNFGGDEVPDGALLGSPKCQQFMDDEGYTKQSELKKYFVLRIAAIANDHGLNFAGWEDGLMDTEENKPYNRSLFPNAEVYGFFWDNVWESGTGQRAYLLANAGYKGVLSHATHLYFDFPYEPDPEERGQYWATRYTDVSKAFGFSAANIYDNMDILDGMGDPIDQDYICTTFGCPPLDAGKENNIIGMQGHIWSEVVRTGDQLDYMVFPRMLAVAERAWHVADWEQQPEGTARDSVRQQDWEKFANTLGYKELARLGDMGVAYQLPPPGARYEEEKLVASTNYPGLPIQYSVNGGQSWNDYTAATTLDPGTTVSLRSKSADSTRTSRVVQMDISTSGATCNKEWAMANSLALFLILIATNMNL